jgi:hypothetical protein
VAPPASILESNLRCRTFFFFFIIFFFTWRIPVTPAPSPRSCLWKTFDMLDVECLSGDGRLISVVVSLLVHKARVTCCGIDVSKFMKSDFAE